MISLEVITIPVGDVDRAKAFYEQAGFTVDVDYAPTPHFRVVQLTPPGSGRSIQIGIGLTTATPGSLRGVCLVVPDLEAAHATLMAAEIDVQPIRHKTTVGAWDGSFSLGIDPQRRDYASFADFADPDGNAWTLQERGYRHARAVTPTGQPGGGRNVW